MARGQCIFNEQTLNSEKKKKKLNFVFLQIPNIMYGCLNIHLNVKDTRSRMKLPCVLLFIFDLICHANILIHLCTAGEAVITA